MAENLLAHDPYILGKVGWFTRAEKASHIKDCRREHSQACGMVHE